MHILLSGLAIAGGNQQKGENMDEGMTNQQFNSFLEILAQLVERANTVEEAARLIREAKAKEEPTE